MPVVLDSLVMRTMRRGAGKAPTGPTRDLDLFASPLAMPGPRQGWPWWQQAKPSVSRVFQPLRTHVACEKSLKSGRNHQSASSPLCRSGAPFERAPENGSNLTSRYKSLLGDYRALRTMNPQNVWSRSPRSIAKSANVYKCFNLKSIKG